MAGYHKIIVIIPIIIIYFYANTELKTDELLQGDNKKWHLQGDGDKGLIIQLFVSKTS